MNILAVDDERNVLRAIKEAICEAEPSADVIAFQNGEDAIDYAKDHAVDVAFLDICMSDVDGLTLAVALKATNPAINVIFVTSYSEYAIDAIGIHASGYLMKPVVAEDIRKQLDNLLNPVAMQEAEDEKSRVFAHTFGNFDLFVDEKPVSFRLSKSKEMLAYLIEREGSIVSRKELASVLFGGQSYDRKTQDYMSKIFRALKLALETVGVENMLVKGHNQYAVDPSAYTSDVRAFFRGEEKARKAYRGEYMAQYSWGETTKSELKKMM